MQIHPTAIVSPKAELGKNVEIGPYAIVEEDVQLGDGSTVGSHTVVGSYTVTGKNCRIFPHAVIGMPPQDLKFEGEKTYLKIGDNTVVREFATLNRGTGEGGGETVIGPDNFIMAYAHLAHDCKLGKHVILANAVNVAGHVTIGDYAIIGGMSAIHQFVSIGEHAILGGASAIAKDVVPYAMAAGNRVEMQGLNMVGLKRRGFPEEEIKILRAAYKILFKSDLNTTQALEEIEKQGISSVYVDNLIDFIKNSERGICK